uniref:mRNA decay activator protein ZFP36L3-like n=1 Tax=Panthera onca TaxID=9690 RepID=UPI0029552A32
SFRTGERSESYLSQKTVRSSKHHDPHRAQRVRTGGDSPRQLQSDIQDLDYSASKVVPEDGCGATTLPNNVHLGEHPASSEEPRARPLSPHPPPARAEGTLAATRRADQPQPGLSPGGQAEGTGHAAATRGSESGRRAPEAGRARPRPRAREAAGTPVLTPGPRRAAAASRLQVATKSGGGARRLRQTRENRVPKRKAAAAQPRYRLSRSRTVHGPAPPAACQQPGPRQERHTAASAATATDTRQLQPPGLPGAAASSRASGRRSPGAPGAGRPTVAAAGTRLRPAPLLSVASGCMLLPVPLRTGTSPALLSPGAALDGGLCAAPPPLAAPAAAAAAAAPEAQAVRAHALAGGPPRERLQQTPPSSSQRPLSAATRRRPRSPSGRARPGSLNDLPFPTQPPQGRDRRMWKRNEACSC